MIALQKLSAVLSLLDETASRSKAPNEFESLF